MGSGEGVVAVSAYMGSGVLSSAYDVLGMSVVRGVGGVCDMCMCLSRGGVGGVGCEWVTGLTLGYTHSGGAWGKWDMCLCFGCGGVGGVAGDCVGGLVHGLEGGVMLCMCVLRVWILFVDVVFVCGRYRKSRLVCVW